MNGPIAVLGRGAWGTALAKTLGASGRKIETWARDVEISLVPPCPVVICATSAQSTRTVLKLLAPAIAPSTVIVLAAKGLETDTLLRQSQIAGEVLAQNPLAVLSGPGFATDLTAGLPTALTLACNSAMAEDLQATLATPTLRPYLTDDIVGAELGGALKNVIAIACGVVIGSGLGESARAALMARGFAEIQRIGTALCARPETLAGLSGLGDLTLTCTSEQSRNFSFGRILGNAGHASTIGTVEGIATASAAHQLAGNLGIDAPVIQTVAALVSGELSVQDAIKALYNRPLRRE